MFSYGSGLAASLYVIETLEISRAVHTVRSLDIDNSSKVSVAESMEISRRFAIAYEYLREQPDVAPLIERLGLKDSEVNKTANLALFEASQRNFKKFRHQTTSHFQKRVSDQHKLFILV
eukprot:c20546_g1_i6.p2 GENE.c20546_g1_i6~~c20546_g1_i6.p2  ORF type:complete len:119 (-),score=25.17 c20546_g1_i6:291-647(-)